MDNIGADNLDCLL